MAISKTGVKAFDDAALAAEQAHQAALAGAPTAAAAKLADQIYFTAIIAAGIANNVVVTNSQTGLAIINNQPGPNT
jgi:hypothetical protein